MMKSIFTLAMLCLYFFPASARIWRVNNNAGVNANFTTFNAAVAAASAGDTIHLEASATQYSAGSVILSKQLVVIGPGYYLNPANASFPGNAGLQANTQSASLAFFRISLAAAGSRFIGLTLEGGIYLNGGAGSMNLLFDRCLFLSPLLFENGNPDGVTVRKCFFQNAGISFTSPGSNFVLENSIFSGSSAVIGGSLTGTGNIIRNNTFFNTYISSISNTYFANNIISDTNYDWVFLNSTIKNNLFGKASQPLPGTATANQTGVTMSTVFLGTGSYDGRHQLKAGSPAIGAGVTIGGITPDCGAYGGPDPYRLSGIPNIPTIYSLTVPTSIPSGSATMNVTISTRNNN